MTDKNKKKLIPVATRMPSKPAEPVVAPIPLDRDAIDMVVAYLGNQPWRETNHLMEAMVGLVEASIINYNLAFDKTRGIVPTAKIQGLVDEVQTNANANANANATTEAKEVA